MSIVSPDVSKTITTEDLVKVLDEGVRVVKVMDKVVKFLEEEYEDDYDYNVYPSLGYTLADHISQRLVELTSKLSFCNLDLCVRIDYFKDCAGHTKFYRAIKNISHQVELFNLEDSVSGASVSELLDRKYIIRYSLGDFVYGLYNIYKFNQIPTSKQKIEKDKLKLSNMYLEYSAKYKVDLGKLSQFLRNMKLKYITVLPMFESDPVLWDNFSKTLPKHMLNRLLEYGSFVYPTDVRLAQQGKLNIDDDYLNRLETREREATDGDYIMGAYPDQWYDFLRVVPDEYLSFVYDNDLMFRIGLIAECVKEKSFSKEHYNCLKDFFEKGIATEYFSQGDKDAETTEFFSK